MPKSTDAPPKKIEADFTEAEIARRRDEVTRRMLNTPYSPQATKKAKAAKAKKKRKATAKA